MSFGTGVSFGRFCRRIKIGIFPRIRASRKLYDSYEIYEDYENDKMWIITPDGKFHDDIEIETEEDYYYFTPVHIDAVYKGAL